METIANIEQDPMKKKKKKITNKRGRPPKYITDDKGREIVGISYHEQIEQYYITQSQPRIYLGKNKQNAIDQFQNSYRQYCKAAQKKGKKKDEIYNKALELFSVDNLIRDRIRQIASDLLSQHLFLTHNLLLDLEERIKMAIQQKLGKESDLRVFIDNLAKSISAELVPDSVKTNICREDNDRVVKLIKEMTYLTALQSIIDDDHAVPKITNSLTSDINDAIYDKIKEEARAYYQNEGQESLIWERAYDLIMEDPIKASKKLGIKEVAYLGLYTSTERRGVSKPPRPALPWWFVWQIYEGHVDQDAREPQEEVIWKCTGVGLGLDTDIEKVSIEKLIDASKFNSSSAEMLLSKAEMHYPKVDKSSFSHINLPQDLRQRLIVIRNILFKVYECGYHQCINLYMDLNK